MKVKQIVAHTTRKVSLLVFAMLLATPLKAQDALLRRPEIISALAHIEANYDRYILKQVEISEIPSPPFKEHIRAEFMADEFSKLGLEDVQIDPEGNVLGLRPGNSDRILVISAHVDTVFPEGTDVTVSRDGNLMKGPGIVDDSIGLMYLLALIEELDTANIRTEQSILFVGTVGEEGLGDLRGVKYLINSGIYKDLIDAFISVDGADAARIVNGGLGSKRYRITISGPGGHSWGDFGRVNPAHALGRIIAQFSSMPVPSDPKTSYNIGRIGGGTSINSIPAEVWMEVDMRSVSDEALTDLETVFLETIRQGISAENLFRISSDSQLSVEIDLIGDRPSGFTSEDNSIVNAARWATTAVGLEPRFVTSSTDSNYPMSKGIPAITISGGGESGDTHSPSEWYDPTDAFIGLQRVFLLVLAYDMKLTHAR